MFDDLAAIAPGYAIPVDWSAERYHADRRTVSRSALLELLRNPPRYHALHEARTIPPDPPTTAMVFGTLAHLAVLEPHEFERRVLKQIGPDAIIVKRDTIETLLEIRRAVLAHPMVGALLTNPTTAERTVLWRPAGIDAEVDGELVQGDIVVRVRPDLLTVIDDDDGPLVYVSDLKTCRSAHPDDFATDCARGRYHLQAALYSDAVAALFQTERVYFVLIAAEKEPPFTVACHEFDQRALEFGANQYRRALIDLVRRRHTGDWTADWQRSVNTLRLPQWAFPRENQ